jgi:hypothetical protein
MTFFTRRRLRVHAAALIVGLWGVALINFATPGTRTLNGHVKGEDWAHFWAVGRVAARHDARGLYDLDALKQEFERATGDIEAPTFVPVYGPQLALALAPFGILPYGVSLVLWWIAGAAAYWFCSRAVWRRYPTLGTSRVLLLFAAAYPAFWQLIIHGQTTWMALACFTVIWWSLREGRSVPAGIALGMLAYKPQLGIAIFAAVLVLRWWSVLFVATATLAAQAAVCWLWFGADVFRAYGTMLAALPRISPLLEPKIFQLVSLRGFVLLLGGSERLASAATMIGGAAVLILVVHGWQRRSFDVSFALLLIATLLVGAHTSVYDLVLLAPAFIMIVGEQGGGGTVRGLRPLLYAAFLLALTGPLVAITRVQLAAPVLIALLIVVLRTSDREDLGPGTADLWTSDVGPRT